MQLSENLFNKYTCLVVDPPWDQGKTGKRSVRPNQSSKLDYPTMTIEEIKKIPLNDIASENAYLWLWATNSRSKSTGRPIITHAFDLMEHWGFRYYTMITWDKRTGPCPFGPYQITTEHCLFGYNGKANFPKESLGKMKTVFAESSQRHSEKPAILYDFIRKFFPEERVDIFARRRHVGFDALGNQVEC